MKYVIDTHALIWFFEGNSRLRINAKAILSSPDSQLVIPATTLAEAVWIEVIEKTIHLSTINEMHDRQIAATALVLASKGEDVKLLTCDLNITNSGLVPIVW